VTGTTASTNYPLQSAIHGDRGGEDAFVTKLANSVAELSVSAAATPDPVNSGSQITYAVTVSNTGADTAGDVIMSATTPAGTTFASIVEPEGAECTTPPPGGTGTITCRIARLAAGASATITIVLNVTAPEGAILAFTATATTTATDTNPTNNAASMQTNVIAAVDPPIVTSVTKRVVAGKPFRIRITGSNFQPGIQVFIGSDETPWPEVKYKNSTTLVLKGATLKSQFPKGVPTPIRLVNPDGGRTTTSFTR
jgi:uncharacterized repeat protein (TIGR01451 family)